MIKKLVVIFVVTFSCLILDTTSVRADNKSTNYIQITGKQNIGTYTKIKIGKSKLLEIYSDHKVTLILSNKAFNLKNYITHTKLYKKISAINYVEILMIILMLMAAMITVLKALVSLIWYFKYIEIILLIIGIIILASLDSWEKKKIRQVITEYGITAKKERNEIFKMACKNRLSHEDVPLIIKVKNYNKKISGKKIPLSEELLLEIDEMGFEKYQTLVKHYNDALEVAANTKRPKNFPRNCYRRFVTSKIIEDELIDLLSDDFDAKAVGEEWRERAKEDFYEKQKKRRIK